MRKFKRLAALVGAVVLAFTMSASVFAADEIKLDGDEGASSLIGKYEASGNKYKYLGFATTKDATSDYKYLQITYTGDITSLRIEFNREDDSNEGPYWMNPDGQTLFFKTVDGSAIPLVADKETTITLDLSAIDINIGDFRGLHLHYLDPNAQSGSFEIKDAKLLKAVEGATAASSDEEETTTKLSDELNGKNDDPASEGDPGTSGGSTAAPSTGSPVLPIAVAVGGLVVAGAAFTASKKIKVD